MQEEKIKSRGNGGTIYYNIHNQQGQSRAKHDTCEI